MFLSLPDPDPLVRSTDPNMKKSLKKGVGSGSISRSYESENPDPHQYVTDPPTLFPSIYFFDKYVLVLAVYL
jgi:hypothetical protein